MTLVGTGSVAERVMPRDVAEGMAAVLRAMADPLRLQIVSVLATAPSGQVAAGEIAGITDLTAPTVSHHLRSLREAHVVVSQRRGTSVLYALAPGMERVTTTLLEALSTAALRAPVAGGVADADPPPADADTLLTHADERLRSAFADLDDDLVTRTLRESFTDLARTARTARHLPVLAERFAAQRLQDVRRIDAFARDGAGRGGAAGRAPQVLFVCVANAGRSQLAAALLQRYAGDAVVVRSAGSMPAADIHTSVQPLLAELLGDVRPGDTAFPKPLTDDAVRAADVVVTMGCGDRCPVLPGTRYEDWAVGDPALASPQGARAILDDLDNRVRALVAELLPGTPTESASPTAPTLPTSPAPTPAQETP